MCIGTFFAYTYDHILLSGYSELYVGKSKLWNTANLAHLHHCHFGEWADLTVLFSWYLQNGSQALIISSIMGSNHSSKLESIYMPIFFTHNTLYLDGVNSQLLAFFLTVTSYVQFFYSFDTIGNFVVCNYSN